MKIKFEPLFRLLLIALALLSLWPVWQAFAQNETNNTAAAGVFATTSAGATNAAAIGARTPAREAPEWVDHLAADFPFLKYPVWDNELWKYLFSLIYIFLAFYVSKFVDFLTRIWLRRLAQKTETEFDDLLLELLHGPVKVVVFVIFLRIGLEAFSWPEVVGRFLAKGFTVIVAISITYMVMKLVDLLMSYWHQRTQGDGDTTFNQQLFPIIRKSLKLFVLVVAILVTLDNLGVNITAAIASLSIGGLAVGLAAQDTLGNLFGAIAIFADKPFHIGDRIRLDAVDGVVETVGLRSTRVRTGEGHLATIPNKTMGNATITNVTRQTKIKTEFNLGLTYDTSAEKIKRALAILEEIYRAHPMTAELQVSFNKFNDSSLNILVVHLWNNTDSKAYLAAMQEMNLKVKERFDAERIAFAFPTRTLHLKQDSDWRFVTGPEKTTAA